MLPYLDQSEPDAVRLSIKAVPGASRSELAGVLGDRLKVRIAAPAQGGKANKAICELFAKVFAVSKREVSIVSGHTDPHKVVRIGGVSVETAQQVLG